MFSDLYLYWFYIPIAIIIFDHKIKTMKKFFLLITLVFSFTYHASAQKIGGKVKVLDFGRWISGTLLSIKDGQYFVTFDDKYYKDRLVKEKDIVFLEGAATVVKDTVYKIKRDTIYLKKTQKDTIVNYKRDTVTIVKIKRDTVFNLKRDTLTIFKTKRDTVFAVKLDTLMLVKVVKDTVYKFKHDTIVINRTIKDTIINSKKETVNTIPVKSNPFRLGELVLAYQDAEWKPCVIIKINTDDTYTVKFDGSSDFYNKTVGIGSLKLRNPASTVTPAYRLGDLVQVYDDTEWKPAVIIKINSSDLYTVKFDGSSDFYNKAVGIGSIKPR